MPPGPDRFLNWVLLWVIRGLLPLGAYRGTAPMTRMRFLFHGGSLVTMLYTDWLSEALCPPFWAEPKIGDRSDLHVAYIWSTEKIHYLFSH